MLREGELLAGYRIERVLGHGGMGVVYCATQLSLDRTVALKVVAPHLGNDPIFRERFRREGRIQAGLDHPNIIAIYEAGESAEGLFIAMRLVEGKNLKELLLAGELTPSRLLPLLRQVADALDTAHEAGLIHRDIKPQNVLVGPRDRAYLADFGLTKPPGQGSLTQSGQFVGSFDYISPEQIHGQPSTPRSDIYSFGVVAYECLTGAVPYGRESEAAILFAHVSEPPPPASNVNPLLPRALDDILGRALAKDPGERFPTATSFVEALEELAGQLPAAAPEPRRELADPFDASTNEVDEQPSAPTGETMVDRARTTPPPPSPAVQDRLWTWRFAAIALVVLLTLAGAGVAAGRASDTEEPREGLVRAERGIIRFLRPESWKSATGPKSKYGMRIGSSLQITAPAGTAGARLVAGTVDGRGRTLLPSGNAAAALTIDPKRRSMVKLGNSRAYAYRGTDRDLVAYFTASDKGVVAVVCENLGGPASALPKCMEIANTLRLKARSVPLGASPAFARVLTAALNRVRRIEREQLLAMKRAKATAAQAASAGRIGRAYKAARTSVAKTHVSPEGVIAKRAIQTQLLAIERAYGRLSTAASKSNKKEYVNAVRLVAAAERRLAVAIKQLRAHGYRIR